MRGQGRGGGSDGAGASSNWKEEVRLKILKEAEGICKSVPSYYLRFDASENKHHPSIFKRRISRPNSLNHGVIDATAQHPPQSPAAELAAGTSIGAAAMGPYHLSSASAAGVPPLITHVKKCCIGTFLAGERFGLDTDDFLDWAGRNGDRARGSGCYERDSFTMDSKDLAVMLMLDGCLLLFAVFLLRASVSEDQGPANLAREKEHQKEFSRLSADISLHMRQTRLDLLILDNQIPFFVLAELHQRLRGTLFQNNNQSIQELTLSCFDDIHPSGFKLWQEDEIRHRSGGLPHDAAGDGGGTEPAVHHFQYLFHLSRVPTGKHKVGVDSILPKEPESHLPSATELESSTSFTHITFRAATLHQHCVPEDNAWDARRDEHPRPLHPWLQRVRLPQPHRVRAEPPPIRCGLGVTAYSICMARLLQREADVKVLRKRGILVHTQKTDKEIVDFFKDMRDEYGDTLMPEDLLALCRNVTAHRRSKARRVMKRIRLQYFPRQTVTFFVIFGAIISIATLINTVHSMYRHYHPYCKGTSPSYGP